MIEPNSEEVFAARIQARDDLLLKASGELEETKQEAVRKIQQLQIQLAQLRAVKVEALEKQRDAAVKEIARLILDNKKTIRRVINSMAPWTRQQVKYLLSDASPLTKAQQRKMKSELHADPSLGHKRKGSKALKKSK